MIVSTRGHLSKALAEILFCFGLRLFQQPGGVISHDAWRLEDLGSLGSSPAGSWSCAWLRQSRDAHGRGLNRRRRVCRRHHELARRSSLFKQGRKQHAQRTAYETKDRGGGGKKFKGPADHRRREAGEHSQERYQDSAD